MRLWLLDQVQDIRSAVKALIRVLAERADNEKEYCLPGYTHLQVLFSGFSVHIEANGMVAGTTYSMVPSFAIIRIVLAIRPRTFEPADSTDLCPTIGVWRSGRKPIQSR